MGKGRVNWGTGIDIYTYYIYTYTIYKIGD